MYLYEIFCVCVSKVIYRVIIRRRNLFMVSSKEPVRWPCSIDEVDKTYPPTFHQQESVVWGATSGYSYADEPFLYTGLCPINRNPEKQHTVIDKIPVRHLIGYSIETPGIYFPSFPCGFRQNIHYFSQKNHQENRKNSVPNTLIYK